MSEVPADPNPSRASTDAHAKALAINLDASRYGTFAEIGAGQEVARWFLRVGGASGTVAQTICAYDKTFSDDTYGGGTRYVSRERLLAMLDHEYKLLVERLGEPRGHESRFFVFADTVAARNFKGDNEQHGWLGLRFQQHPAAPPNDILLHVNLIDPTAQMQQEAVGLLGVNLLHAAFFKLDPHDSNPDAAPDDFLAALFEDLSIDRLEIDVIELCGPALAHLDARRLCLRALRCGMCRALVFDSDARITEPANLLRKRPLLVERGRFESIERFQNDMLKSSQAKLRSEGIELTRDPAPVLEMSLHSAIEEDDPDDDGQLLARIDRLVKMGTVVVSDLPLTYALVQYLRRYTHEPIRLVLGVATLARILHDSYYNELAGGLLEGLGKLLASNVKVYAYPMPVEAFYRALPEARNRATLTTTTGLIGADDVKVDAPISHLYQYLRSAGWIVPIEPV